MGVETPPDSSNPGWISKLGATLNILFRSPGALSTEFVAGGQSGRIGPLALLILFSAAYFIASATAGRMAPASSGDAGALLAPGGTIDSAAFVNDPVIQENLIARAIGPARVLTLLRHPEVVATKLGEVFPVAMLALMPVFALLTALAWPGGAVRFPGHMAFSMHLHAAWFAAIAVPPLLAPIGSDLLSGVAELGSIIYSTWYAIAAFGRMFGGDGRSLFWRSTLVGLLYAPIFLGVVLGALYFSFAR